MTVSPLGVLAPIIEGEAVLPLPGIRLRFVPIGEFPALRREAISVTICRLIDASFFSTFNMDRWTDQQAYIPIENLFVMFLGFPDKIYEEKP